MNDNKILSRLEAEYVPPPKKKAAAIHNIFVIKSNISQIFERQNGLYVRFINLEQAFDSMKEVKLSISVVKCSEV